MHVKFLILHIVYEGSIRENQNIGSSLITVFRTIIDVNESFWKTSKTFRNCSSVITDETDI